MSVFTLLWSRFASRFTCPISGGAGRQDAQVPGTAPAGHFYYIYIYMYYHSPHAIFC